MSCFNRHPRLDTSVHVGGLISLSMGIYEDKIPLTLVVNRRTRPVLVGWGKNSYARKDKESSTCPGSAARYKRARWSFDVSVKCAGAYEAIITPTLVVNCRNLSVL